MNSVIRVVKNLIFVVAIIILVVCMICFSLHIRTAVVMSGSMEPAIKTGSLILINTTDNDINEGDIIAFHSGKAEVAHRVVEITSEGYVTKGDANETRDFSIVSENMVIGKILFWIPALGYVISWFSAPAGIITVVTACICFLLLELLCKKEGDPDESESAFAEK